MTIDSPPRTDRITRWLLIAIGIYSGLLVTLLNAVILATGKVHRLHGAGRPASHAATLVAVPVAIVAAAVPGGVQRPASKGHAREQRRLGPCGTLASGSGWYAATELIVFPITWSQSSPGIHELMKILFLHGGQSTPGGVKPSRLWSRLGRSTAWRTRSRWRRC